MLLSLTLLSACTGERPIFTGIDMSPHFPMDGARTAQYFNEDNEEGWKLVIEMKDPPERVDDEDVVTFEWRRDDTEEIIGAVKWSSSSGEGIRIHAYAVGLEDFITFDKPVMVSDDDDKMLRGDSVTTETNGYTFTSTYVGPEDCPVNWGNEWKDCVHIRLDDGDGDDMVGPIFAGDYWLVQRYGPAWMELTGHPGRWDLSHYDFAAD